MTLDGEKSKPGSSACVVVEEAVATPPFDAAAWLTRPADGGGCASCVPHASTSTSRLRPPSALLMTTRMRVVLTGWKVSFRHTLPLLVTTPPGTVTQPEPSQRCTSKTVTPYF